MIQVENLTLQYPGGKGIRNVSFHVGEGQVVLEDSIHSLGQNQRKSFVLRLAHPEQASRLAQLGCDVQPLAPDGFRVRIQQEQLGSLLGLLAQLDVISFVALWEESLSRAQAVLAAAQQALAEQQALYEAGAISLAELREYERAVESAQSQTVTTRAQLTAAQNNVQAIAIPTADEQAIAAAQADLDLTKLQIRQLERSRENYLIRAAADGVVISASLEPGTTVAAGQGVFKLSSEKQQYAVFYLPQDYLSQVAFGDELSLSLQGSQEEAGRGRVVYIDLQAVYPPEDYENDGNRNQRSVKIKAELIDGGPFSVGQSLFLRLAAVQT